MYPRPTLKKMSVSSAVVSPDPGIRLQKLRKKCCLDLVCRVLVPGLLSTVHFLFFRRPGTSYRSLGTRLYYRRVYKIYTVVPARSRLNFFDSELGCHGSAWSLNDEKEKQIRGKEDTNRLSPLL